MFRCVGAFSSCFAENHSIATRPNNNDDDDDDVYDFDGDDDDDDAEAEADDGSALHVKMLPLSMDAMLC